MFCPFPFTAALEIFAPQSQSGDADFAFNAEVIFGQQRLGDSKVSFELGIQKCCLETSLEGVEIVRGSRYGVIKQTNEIELRVSEQSEQRDELSAAGESSLKVSAGPSGFSAGADLDGSATTSRSRQSTRQVSKEGVELQRKVYCHGTYDQSVWHIHDPENAVLVHSYLSDEILFRGRPTDDRGSVTARLYCHEDQLELLNLKEKGGRWSLFSKAKEQLAKRLIAKELGHQDEELGFQIELGKVSLPITAEWSGEGTTASECEGADQDTDDDE